MQKHSLVIAVSGVKNSGKTTLIERLIPALQSRGHTVAVIKHDGHTFTPDTPGTDSRRFWEQGVAASAVFDSEKTSVVYRGSVAPEQLIAAFSTFADIILLEGFKSSDYSKVELVRSGVSMAPVCNPDTCIAYVSDLPLQTERPVFSFDAIDLLAEHILSLPRCTAES